MGRAVLKYNRFAKIAGTVLAVVYFFTGLLLLLDQVFLVNFNGTKRYLLGALLVLYGSYRIYRGLILINNRSDED